MTSATPEIGHPAEDDTQNDGHGLSFGTGKMRGKDGEFRTGMVFETDPVTGRQICTNPGTVTWSSSWPPEARARIEAAEAEAAQLRSRLLQAEKGVGAMNRDAVVDRMQQAFPDLSRLDAECAAEAAFPECLALTPNQEAGDHEPR